MYVPDAIIKNTGPKTMKDFIKQRRRVYSGHLELSKKSGYKPVSINSLSVLRGFKKSGRTETGVVVVAFVLESLSRILGIYDFLFNRERHLVWDMVKR